MFDSPTASSECPRCSQPATETYYGPCARCRSELRATFAAVPQDIVDTRFEPVMHVTPNAVATKD